MRILYIDIDSLRPDHLGCYGYHRNTSPNIDRVATDGIRFVNNYISDAPCLPSRTAMWSGRHGIHTGVIDHIGSAADPFLDGPTRKWHSVAAETNWMTCLRRLGLKTVSISSFAERHSAWSWYAGYSEIYNPGYGGHDVADQVSPIAIDWIKRNGRNDNWFLHVNYWDVHWPYRVPAALGSPFEQEPIPQWLTEEIRRKHWAGYGPKSARDLGYRVRAEWEKRYPRQPVEIASMQDVRKMFDGYDTSVSYVDSHIGRLINTLVDLDVLDETVIVISADHGESLGELNMYMSHRVADHTVSRVPLIVRWPGLTEGDNPRVDKALHYHFDFAATVVELLGGEIPENWDAVSYAGTLANGEEDGRDCLILGAGAGGLTRSVRFDRYLCLRAYHDGYNGLPDTSLFDLENDPQEANDMAVDRQDLVDAAMTKLEQWYGRMMQRASHSQDPMWSLLVEGGPQDMRGQLAGYLKRLRETGREEAAAMLEARYPNEQ